MNENISTQGRKEARAQVERVNEFHCCGRAMAQPDLIAHLITAHGFVKGTQCRRSLVQALDGSNFYSNVFEWEIPCDGKTIKVQQVNSGPTHDARMTDDE